MKIFFVRFCCRNPNDVTFQSNMDLREALVQLLHLHTVCRRNQQQGAKEMVQQRNCNAAVQLWDVSVLKE